MQLIVRTVRSEHEWDSLRLDWDTLFGESPYAVPALDFLWLREWWQVYGASYGSGGLAIVTVWKASRLEGVLPLYLTRMSCSPLAVRRLMFLSTGEAECEETCPDYLGILCRAGGEQDCVDAAWHEVSRLDWDRLDLLDVAADSPLFRVVHPSRLIHTFSRGVCPVAELSAGFDAYLKHLSPNSRQQARRLLREGEAADARLEIPPAEQCDAVFDDLVAFHKRRWLHGGKAGAFSSERFMAFHRALIRQWAPTGKSVLGCLLVSGRRIAVLYGFVLRGTFYFYQSGILPEAREILRSPGNLAHLLLMRELSTRGVATYDFLRGASSYKQRLATGQKQLTGLRVWRRTPRAVTGRLALVASRAMRKIVHVLTGRHIEPLTMGTSVPGRLTGASVSDECGDQDP